MVKTTGAVFVKSFAFTPAYGLKRKAITSLTFIGASIFFSPILNRVYAATDMKAYCTELLANSSDVKGIASIAGKVPNSIGIVIFLALSFFGLWYLAHSKTRKTLW